MRRRNFIAGFTGLVGAPMLSGTAAAAGVSAADSAGRHGGHGRGRRRRRVRSGIEELAARDYDVLAGQRVGMISNPTGVLPDLTHEVDEIVRSGQVDLVAVFGPEHGFRGTSQAGEGEEFFIDAKTGLPVYNAYRDPERIGELYDEAGVDTVVFDIQDVGARFYTYIWTMYWAMVAAARRDKRFVVLDRPNPITGRRAAGPVLHYPEFATFVGERPISQQHGMTVGELAQLFNAEFLPDEAGTQVDLTVVPMRGWFRDMWYEETGLPWVAPSPNMPTVDTATVYPGTCLFEAGHPSEGLAEGRGTTKPFQLIGAPHLDHAWEEALDALDLPGVGFREAYFNPTFSKYQGRVCGGVELFVTDRDDFDPIHTAIAMLIEARKLQPDGTTFWRTDNWIDKLTGSTWVRQAINDGLGADEVVDGWHDELSEFRSVREKHLIYHQMRRREERD
ncbi:exo-beta-N-acetylmuramidase NamZ family protein [Phytoactinopolyspora halotolerans]|uniref:DUF1343 domain-containing protein n=1 Tax=Phytoactinopolyspora halotolerans TaxID=1981512 RepID=A0A6L9SF07_9ACTN|nr:DUF1343 domain-containing protein [Phytoactinopolyspora halotolerans]NEE03244.1 DUF1343 domain-containing protein [Phytoactinopolyspora halotolerans]